MSKRFPALRFHGNKEAGFRHIKRGMYELGITEDLRERMGVPVYKRTVEVSEHTHITVEIHKEQTFIHIYSNPPSLPEKLHVEEEEEKKLYRCPSVFIVRQMLDGPVSDDQEHDGYLIGYNHDTNRWHIVTYDNILLDGAAPQGGNLGWYHLHNDEDGTFNECDVVTWKKHLSPNFRSAYLPNYLFPITLRESVYFQGIRFSAPDAVAGACILKAGPDSEKPDSGEQQNYVYVHTITFIERPEYGYSSIRDNLHRKPLNDALNNRGSWELIWQSPSIFEYASTDKEYAAINWADPDTVNPDGHFLWGARSLDYIDPEGYAYYIREYTGSLSPNDSSYDRDGRGQQALIKQNMKTGSFTIECTPDFVPYVSGVGGEVEDPNSGPNGNRTYTYGDGDILISNQGRRAPLYVFPGTQDLYMIETETEASHGCSYVIWNAVVSGDIPLNHTAGGAGYSRYYVTENRNRIVKTWEVTMDYASSGQLVNSYLSEPIYANEGTANLQLWSILQYHPEMPKAEVSVRSILGVDSFTVDVYLNGQYINYCQKSVPTSYNLYYTLVPNEEPFSAAVSSLNFMFRADDMAYWLDKQWYTPAVAQTDFSVIMNSIGPCHFAHCFSPVGNGLIGYEAGAGRQDFHLQPVFPHAIPGNSGIKFGSFWQEGYNQTRFADSETSEDMVLRRYPIGEDNEDFQVHSYAIHRPVGRIKEKPYILVRKKIKVTENGYKDQNIDPRNTIALMGELYDFQTPTEVVPLESVTAYPQASALTADITGSLDDLSVDPDRAETHWEDDGFELLSNILTAEQLNKITKESGTAFFEIGIL